MRDTIKGCVIGALVAGWGERAARADANVDDAAHLGDGRPSDRQRLQRAVSGQSAVAAGRCAAHRHGRAG